MEAQILLPGAVIEVANHLKIGPGLERDVNSGRITVTESGILKSENGSVWMAAARKRYIPTKETVENLPKYGDMVLGIVTHKHPEYYRVDINAPELATLSAMAFESATKRNRVTVNKGDLVFAKVSVALPDLEPEIVCCNQRTGKSDGMGVLQFTETSNSVNVNIQAARKALTNECIFAKAIAKYTPFEWCVGVNGRVMVTTKHPQVTAQVCRIFPLITFLNNDQIETLVQRALG